MEFENILEEPKKVKVKPKFTVSLVIIAVLIIALIGIGAYLYLNATSSKDVYLGIIDSSVKVLNQALTINDEESVKPYGATGEITMNLLSSDADIKSLANIVNNLKMNLNMEFDVEKKKENIDLDILYKSSNLINADLVVKENDIYVNLGTLYNKAIKLPTEDIEDIWETNDTENYKVIVNEFASVLKNSLDDKYFTEINEQIEISGTKINTIKYVMTLTEQDVETIRKAVLEGIKNNEKLMTALIEVSTITREEIISEIDTMIDYKSEETYTLISEIYVNRVNKDVERIVIKDDTDKVILDRIELNKYEIRLEGEENLVIGYVTMLEDNFNLTSDYADVKTNVDVKMVDDTITINAVTEHEDETIEFNMSIKELNTSGYIRIKSTIDDIDLKINFKLEGKEVDNVSDKMISNYIKYDDLTDDDYGNIMMNLYQNKAFYNLMSDLGLLDTEETLDTNIATTY